MFNCTAIYGQKRPLFGVLEPDVRPPNKPRGLCCLGCPSRYGVPPATIYFSRRAENCDRHRVAEAITALHQTRDQSMASPAGMRGPTTIRSTSYIGESIPMGQGGHVPRQYLDWGDIITNVPLNISGVISATFYPCNIFLISWKILIVFSEFFQKIFFQPDVIF